MSYWYKEGTGRGKGGTWQWVYRLQLDNGDYFWNADQWQLYSESDAESTWQSGDGGFAYIIGKDNESINIEERYCVE